MKVNKRMYLYNAQQWNEPVENWDGVKSHKLNKRTMKGTITKSY